jgi:hypothetical protein
MAYLLRLNDLGFRKGVVAETVVSTYNPDGSSNAAPMGVFMVDDEHVSVNFYNSSQTLANVKANKAAVLNLTRDIAVYYRSAFKDANPASKLPEDWFTVGDVVKAPILWSAEATVAVTLEGLSTVDFDRTTAMFKVHRVGIDTNQRYYPKIYCRAFGATIEAIIHATRVEALAGVKAEQKRVDESLRQIDVCNDVVRRVAPDSEYSVIMADLMKRISGVRDKR